MTLRIFCAVRHSKDPSRFYGDLWSRNFYPALRALGCEIVESETDLLPTSQFMDVADFNSAELEVRAQTTQRILDEVRSAASRGRVHLFLGYFYNAHFDPAGYDELRRLGVPSVNFYCNSIYQFAYVAQIAKAVDFAWHTERDAHAAYIAAGARPVWVQFGADSALYHPIERTTRADEVCFVGQCYADRDRWLAALADAGVPLAIFGNGWGEPEAGMPGAAKPVLDYLGRPQVQPGSFASYCAAIADVVRANGLFPGLGRLAAMQRNRQEGRRLRTKLLPYAKGRADDLAETFGRYEVVLNLSNVWADGRPGSALIPHVRLRDFEAPMCRACYLTGHTDEIVEFYDIGKEIDTYRSSSELIDKAQFYLRHPESAERLREAGWQRARRDHTWTRRFETLFGKIGLVPRAA